jgi:hypothetical protein
MTVILDKFISYSVRTYEVFWYMRNGAKILDVEFVRCCLNVFLAGCSYENPQENKVSGICFQSLA